jgi:hypothetical protein
MRDGNCESNLCFSWDVPDKKVFRAKKMKVSLLVVSGDIIPSKENSDLTLCTIDKPGAGLYNISLDLRHPLRVAVRETDVVR